MTKYNIISGSSMKTQIFVAIGVALVASVLVTGLASTIYAQSNMTGGGNMTGGNMTGGNMSMPSPTGTGDDDGGNGDDDGDGGDGENN
jgi:hypothetical protein